MKISGIFVGRVLFEGFFKRTSRDKIICGFGELWPSNPFLVGGGGSKGNPQQKAGLRFRVPGIELKNPSSPEIRKKDEKITKSPNPGRAPKIRKRYRKNTKTAKKSPFSFFFCIFFVFSGPDPGWGILAIFSSLFFSFSGLEGFLSSIPGARNRKGRARVLSSQNP